MTRIRRHELGLRPERTWHEHGRVITAFQSGVGTWRARIDGVEITGLHSQWPTAWNAYRGALAIIEREGSTP